jgi:hypothetical protein
MKTYDSFDRPSCLVHGRQFIQRGNQWIDAKVEEMPEARHIRVRFDSREFFELIIKYPKTLPYLSGTRNIQLALDDTVYEIYE